MRLHISVFFLMLSGSSVGFDSLVSGSLNSNFDEMTDSEFISFTLQTRKASEFGLKGSQITNYLEVDDRYFAVSKDINLVGLRLEPKELIGIWSMSRWETEIKNPNLGIYTGTFSDPTYGLEFSLETWADRKGIGCYTDTPLRYGDFDSDGTEEVVLLLGDLERTLDLVVFSPSAEKTTFGARLALHDSRVTHTPEYSDFEFVSDINQTSAYQALRSYAKVYVGDFDSSNETAHEIIVWRKRFLANRKDDPVRGFSIERSSFELYVLESGEYIPKDASEEDIKNWLVKNNLTWSKGYPSKSECPGEEGQLIPEMHDPLLNDPDVLN
jgi:hypothetical protein